MPFGKPGEYLTDRLTDEALGVMRKAGDQPFFLYLAHHAPHTPVEAKAELVDHYRRKLKPGMRHQNPTYAAMVHSLDESVGRVMAELPDRRIEDRTVVIFTSDNGGYLQASDGTKVTTNHPLRSGKGSLYEGGVRVPLIVKWPGVTRAGAESGEPVVSTDLYRTLADAAGVPAGGDGMSLQPVLRDPSARLDRDALYFHYPHYYATTSPVSAIRARDWKLLHYHEDGHVEMFNLAQDPGEEHDLAARMPGKADELKAKLDRWLRSVDAQRPEPNPRYSKP